MQKSSKLTLSSLLPTTSSDLVDDHLDFQDSVKAYKPQKQAVMFIFSWL